MQKEESQGETNSSKSKSLFVATKRLTGRFRSATKRSQRVADVFAPRSLASTEWHLTYTSPLLAIPLAACIPCL